MAATREAVAPAGAPGRAAEPPRRRLRSAWLVLPALVFVLVPVVALAVKAPWSRAAAALSDSGAWTALRVSLEVTLGAVAISLVVAMPAAWALARTDFPGRRLVRAFIVLPIVLPPVVAGVALLATFGRLGLVGGLMERAHIHLVFTTAGAAVATAFVSAPFLVLALESGFRSIDPRFEDAGRSLGASRWYVFRRVTLPQLRPALAAGLVLTWARALGEFGATITFAGNFRGTTQTLPLAVYQALQTDPGAAYVVSLLMLVASVAVLVAVGGRLLVR
ncbi:MAG TPA: ABC transporter permease [Actinomycetota bacterium]|jgi:molybdate transport system permease protein